MLKFIIITLCIFILIRFFSKMFIIKTFKSMNQRMQDQFNRQQPQNRPEGTITIDPGVEREQKKRQSGNDDYVDFEEVK